MLNLAPIALTVLSALTSVGHSSPLAWRGPPNSPSSASSARAAYFLKVNPAGSSVVAIVVDSNGQLQDHTSETSTEGVGLQSLNATAGDATVGADPLQGQDSVWVQDNVCT